MKLSKIRRDSYRLARVLGDVQAVERGPVAVEKRIVRKAVYRSVFKLLRGLR